MWWRIADNGAGREHRADGEGPAAAPLGGRLASRLFYYWYYREMMVEARGWLELGHQVLLDGDPVDLFLATIGLAAAMTLQRAFRVV